MKRHAQAEDSGGEEYGNAKKLKDKFADEPPLENPSNSEGWRYLQDLGVTSSLLHPNNHFRTNPPSFEKLSNMYPEFRALVKENGSIDFKDSHSVRALNKFLLLSEFGISVEFPSDRLCPPIPNRLNYLHWLSEILVLGSSESELEIPRGSRFGPTSNEPMSVVNGEKKYSKSADTNPMCRPHILDIGVGSSCIYPLLGAHTFNWTFTGSDIDRKSLQCAEGNRNRNSTLADSIALVGVKESTEMQSAVQVLLRDNGILDKDKETLSEKKKDVSNESFKRSLLDNIMNKTDNSRSDVLRGPLRCALVAMGGKYVDAVKKCESAIRSSDCIRSDNVSVDFVINACMTNPPFYADFEDIGTNDYTVCSGSKAEMVTSGGEIAFLASIIMDSLVLRESVSWYTAMVGAKSSLGALLRLLKAVGVTNVRTVRFQQSRTCRWALAWSYTSAGEQSLKRRDCSASPRIKGVDEPYSLQREVSIAQQAIQETTLASEVTSISHSISLVQVLRARVQSMIQQWVISNLWICNAELVNDEECDGVCEYLSFSLLDPKHGFNRNNIPTMHVRFEVNHLTEFNSCRLKFVLTCVSLEYKSTICEFWDNLLQNIMRNNRFWRRKLKSK